MTKTERWVTACRADELAAGAARVFREDGLQIALFRRATGELHAVDNRCPHEGYPLVQGYVTGGLLTCAWHNYKFDLRDGRCVIGDEDVRTWPVRERHGAVEVDLARDVASDARAIDDSLERALLEHQLGRAARDVARLIQAGVAPVDVLGRLASFDARRAEYGTTHALALAADVAALVDERAGLDAVHPIVFVADLASEPNVRRPARPRPVPLDVGDPTPAELERRLARLVEAEDAAGAEGLVRGAVARGLGLDAIEPWFWGLVEAHFLDFGHAAIYVRKTFDLLARLGGESARERADELLGALVFRIVHGTRQDTLPPWAAFQGRLDALEPELDELWRRSRETRSATAPRTAWDPRALFDAVLDGTGEAFFDAFVAALRRGTDPGELALCIAAAAGERMRRFDPALDASIDCQDGWLFVTHTLTFANAVRQGLARHPVPSALRSLAFAARFVHGMRPLDRGAPDEPAEEPRAPSTGDVLAALRAGETTVATAAATALLASGRAAELERAVTAATLADGKVRPIIATHAIKTTLAAFEERRALAASRNEGLRILADRPVRGLLHFLGSPVTERSRARIAHEAVRFVGHGKVPNVLSS